MLWPQSWVSAKVRKWKASINPVLCWQLRECDLGAIVNRDLQQRIRPINGLTLYQQVTKSDVKNAAKIVQNFDNRWNMWDDDTVKNNGDSGRPVSCDMYSFSCLVH